MIECVYCGKPLQQTSIENWPDPEHIEPAERGKLKVWVCEEGHYWLQSEHLTEEQMSRAHRQIIEGETLAEAERAEKQRVKLYREQMDRERITAIQFYREHQESA